MCAGNGWGGKRETSCESLIFFHSMHFPSLVAVATDAVAASRNKGEGSRNQREKNQNTATLVTGSRFSYFLVVSDTEGKKETRRVLYGTRRQLKQTN